MKTFSSILIALLLTHLNVFAKEKTKQAHTHGGAKISLAMDGTKGKIIFESAAHGVLGFEYKAKSKKDLQTVADAKKDFTDNFKKMFMLEEYLNCQYTPVKIEQVIEKKGSHSDWVAEFDIACDKSILKTWLAVDFGHYEKIKDIDITVLIDSFQKDLEYKGNPLSVELK